MSAGHPANAPETNQDAAARRVRQVVQMLAQRLDHVGVEDIAARELNHCDAAYLLDFQ